MSYHKFSEGFSIRGAHMGRPEYRNGPDGQVTDAPLFRLQRVALDSGGYDNGGAYWGTGAPLYVAFSGESPEDSESHVAYVRVEQRHIHSLAPIAGAFRARDTLRLAAKVAVLERYKNARFTR
jgi:hypothetical protein